MIEGQAEQSADRTPARASTRGRDGSVAWGFYPEGVQAPRRESIHIATLGTVGAVLMAVPVAFLAAGNLTPYAASTTSPSSSSPRPGR